MLSGRGDQDEAVGFFPARRSHSSPTRRRCTTTWDGPGPARETGRGARLVRPRHCSLQPDYAEAHRNRAMLWLSRGDYERGWPEYEWRWRCRGKSPAPFRQPLWEGEAIEGRTILLHAEQGHGDTLQFIRYAALVKQRGATVLRASCPPSRAVATPAARRRPGADARGRTSPTSTSTPR